ncbi:uncharacterized protein [Diadema antillarum]|uniref:uncharacterized protein n=1 Tax=Diadema antillarum TaxID=105358 RepID=UPI003A881C1A
MDVRLAVCSIAVAVFSALLWLDSIQNASTQATPTFRSALLTKRHTPAPTPPFRVCPCSSSPCHNGGQCVDVRVGSGSSAVPDFECECMDDWDGDVCHVCNSTEGFEIQCSDICFSRKNGICEDGGHGSVSPSLCTLGTDCEDCHARCL